MNCVELGQLIRQKRLEKELTQKGLANQLHVTDKAVSKWERGLCFPDLSLYELLANALDIPFEELMGYRYVEIKKNKSNPKLVIFLISYIFIGIILYCSLISFPFFFFVKRIYKILVCLLYLISLGLGILRLGGAHVKNQ